MSDHPPGHHRYADQAADEALEALDHLALIHHTARPTGDYPSYVAHTADHAGMRYHDGPDEGPTDLPVMLDPGATMPRRAHPADAGLDLFPLAADTAITIPTQQDVEIPTGVHVAIPPGYYGRIEGRSSLARRRVVPVGGVIDSGYSGEVKVVLVNIGWGEQVIGPGQAVAQLVILPILLARPVPVDGLPPTARGSGGFGHTDRRGNP